MKLKSLFCLSVILSIFSLSTAANAQVSEVKFGVFEHNSSLFNDTTGGKEKGPDIEAQIIFESPEILNFAWSPRPTLVANLNTQGETSFGGAGLIWQWEVSENWSIDPFLGLVVHDGDPLDNPFPPWDSANRQRFNDEELALGSRTLFWLGFGISRDLNEDWNLSLTYEHLSHGQILASGKNEGIDNIGVLIGRKF